jgi:hypothetical protein
MDQLRFQDIDLTELKVAIISMFASHLIKTIHVMICFYNFWRVVER